MNNEKYTYDVAFSFLAQDEPLATNLNDLLQDRFKTFLYSKKQGELAGTDGEKTFNQVFGEQARLVVVLYREGWGKTPWTRIEETAIRKRAYYHGYNFVKFIPVEDKRSVPEWLPPTQLWIELKRWGPAGAASVIEERIKELGGEPHEETVEDRATRLERSMKFEAERKQFLNSERGVNAANNEFEALQVELERLIDSVKDVASSIPLSLKAKTQNLVISGLGHWLSIRWELESVFSLNNSGLEIALWSDPPFPGASRAMTSRKPKRLGQIKFKFDLLPTRQVSWISEITDQSAYSTNDLASFILKCYMDKDLKS